MAQLILPVGKQEFHDGTNWYSVATENWVINKIRNVDPCLVATTTSLTATYANGTNNGVGATLTNAGTQTVLTIDGVTLVVNNRVLVKDQTTASQNGIYTVTSVGSASTNWVLTRSTDYDVIAQIVRGDIIPVISGAVFGVSTFMLTSQITTIGTDSFTFVETDNNFLTGLNGTAGQITVTIVNGVATIGLPTAITTPGSLAVTGNLSVTSTEKFKIAVGTTGQRPTTPVVGDMRFNISL